VTEPPHNIEAEQAVLGSMMMSAAAAAEVSSVITPGDYYRPAHQAVHAAILALSGRGDPPDIIAVKDELERLGELRGNLDAPYLHTLIQAVPAAANAGYHARIVARHARSRKMIELAARLRQVGEASDPGDQAAALAAIEAGLAALAAPMPGMSSLPQPVRLDELLAEPDEEIVYRVARLWPVDGRIVLVAQRKAGKTTLTGNLLRCLADGDPLLGRYEVTQPAGTIFHFDTEMSRAMLRRWLADQGIRGSGRIHVEMLRGRVGSFDILQPAVRAEWAAMIRGTGAGVVTFDCIGPVLAALGLNENDSSEVGRFLVAFEALLDQAGVAEAALAHHMGHAAERSRGASRLRDWPDAEWTIVYERPKNGDTEPSPRAGRYFAAAGRDVAESEQRLDFDAVTRRLTVAGGSRKDEQQAGMLAAITGYIEARAEDDCTQNRIVDAVEGRASDIRVALDRAVVDGTLCVHKRGQAHLHRIRGKCPDHNPDTAGVLFGTDTASSASHRVPPAGTQEALTASRVENRRS